MLRVGSSGAQVAKLQNELKAAGFNPGPVDGDFGPQTAAAVKSYQRRNHLDVDGVVGPRTWKALSTDQFSPPSGAHGRPQPAPRPVGHVPAPAPAPTAGASGKVDAMLNEARSHLGFHEGAGNSNPFSHALGRPSEAWCADFVSYCAQKAGLHMNTASAQGVADALKARGTWKGRNNPQPGDAVTFRWDGSHGWADHVGIVEKVFTRNGRLYVQTIEGNSSDQVRRKVYPASSSVINGFGRLT